MDELIEHKSWWKRNWKWFTPVFGVLVFFVIAMRPLQLGQDFLILQKLMSTQI